MSEPSNRVEIVELPAPDLWHGTVHDDRIDFRSETYAVRGVSGEVAWIDPLPLSAAARDLWPRPDAVLLSGACHRRAARAVRDDYGVPVWAPAGTADGAEKPFGASTRLPGGLVGHPGVGPTSPHAWFEWEHETLGPVAYVGDLWMRGEGGAFRPVPVSHREDSDALLARLGSIDWARFELLLPAHGKPCCDARERRFVCR